MGTGNDLDAQRLRTLKHVVVVMMENRSFDHMLGYLPQEGMTEVNGLRGDELNLDRDGRAIRVHAFDAEAQRVLRRGEALQKRLDPDHSPHGVQIQVGAGYGEGTNGGFVRSFIESRKPADRVERDLWSVPMGYYTSKDVPVYDHLARQFCVCDAWHASIPGDTWPNRLYALAGQLGPKVVEGDLWQHLPKPILQRLKGMPLYDVPAFTRQLADHQWRWYSHDPGTLRAADGAYRDPGDLKRDNFAFFDRRKVDFLTEQLERPLVRGASFLDDAARGELPQVSWIDPNFVDLSVGESNSNDDHPPSDIRAGQAFVFDVYDALRRSPHWDDTLLIVTYDEHGGFYDHVPPPPLPADDPSGFRTYGLRVPALFAGPRVRRQVLHAPPPVEGREERDQPQYDHGTLGSTILRAFASDPDAALAKMPLRVQRAPDLGSVLLDEPRTDVDDPRNAGELMAAWRLEARQRRVASVDAAAASGDPGARGVRSVAPDGAGHPLVLTDFQSEWQKLAIGLRHIDVDA
jgi:phospholipase C